MAPPLAAAMKRTKASTALALRRQAGRCRRDGRAKSGIRNRPRQAPGVMPVMRLDKGRKKAVSLIRRRCKKGRNETAINAKGFEVDFLRRQPVDDDPHPFRCSDDEDDLWPEQALRDSALTSAPRA